METRHIVKLSLVRDYVVPNFKPTKFDTIENETDLWLKWKKDKIWYLYLISAVNSLFCFCVCFFLHVFNTVSNIGLDPTLYIVWLSVKTIEGNGNIDVVSQYCRFNYQRILQPISGIPLASMVNLPTSGNLPTKAKETPNIDWRICR